MSKKKAEECENGVTKKAKQNRNEYYRSPLRSSKQQIQQGVTDTIQKPWPAPKTNAERCRAYRARQKAARQQNSQEVIDTIQGHLVEEGSSHSMNLQQAKTSTERVHAYRVRQKNKDKDKPRPAPKTNAEYCLAYRARQKAACQQNSLDVIEIIQKNLAESDGSIAGPNSQQQNSINMRQMDLDFIDHRNNNSSDEESNENQPNVIVVHAEVHRDSLQSIARTSTERVQAYRARQRENLNSSQSKSQPKTVAERVRKYRQRQREKLHAGKNQTHNIEENNNMSEDEDDGELIVKWCMNMIKGTHNLHFM